ncbi:MAG TPA: hypothetical protein VE261_03135, partial [Gaiellaceae bacterium]|nr:hypothetical protein [Gaiellaceae bacterium]
MTASDLVIAVAEIVLGVILIPAVIRAVQDRTRGAIDVALFFGLLDALLLRSAVGLANAPVVGVVSTALAFAIPYLMLRLLVDFGHVPAAVVRTAEVAFALFVVSVFLYPGGATPVPPALTAARAAYFVVLFAYEAVGFIALARRSTGVTRRRMQAVSLGNMLFALAFVAAGVLAVFPALALTSALVLDPAILATGLAWFLGFATPLPVRRVWQEPELRAFFERTATLSRFGSVDAVVPAIVDAATAATGARAALG